MAAQHVKNNHWCCHCCVGVCRVVKGLKLSKEELGQELLPEVRLQHTVACSTVHQGYSRKLAAQETCSTGNLQHSQQGAQHSTGCAVTQYSTAQHSTAQVLQHSEEVDVGLKRSELATQYSSGCGFTAQYSQHSTAIGGAAV